MSDFSVSVMSMASKAVDNQMSGYELSNDTIRTDLSGVSNERKESEQTIVGAEVASRTEDYIGAGTDLSSTGTDVNVRQGINSFLDTGFGSIADKIV